MIILIAIIFIALSYILLGLVLKLITKKGKRLYNKNIRQTILYGRTIDAKAH